MTQFIPPTRPRSKADPRTPAPVLRSSGVGSVRTSGAEISLSLRPLPGEGLMEIFQRLAVALKELDATILHLLVYGSVQASPAATEAMRRVFGSLDWPVTWAEGAACDGQPIAGLQVFGLTGGEVQRVYWNDCVVGSVFDDGAARHCLLGGLGPLQKSSSRADQTKQTLDQLAKVLASAGFFIADTVRTWFFLDDLLSWYGGFNQARTGVYSGIKFRTGSLPASTGVGGRNPAGAALAVAARAMQPLSASSRAREIASPLQCPAPAYGSSFSRAMELSGASGRWLLISGTASIAPGGATLWPEDARRQVAQTMQVVEAILQSRGFSWSDLTRATAYFKRPADAPLFAEWCAAHNVSALPAVLAQCAVCRDDLLFELETDAWTPSGT